HVVWLVPAAVLPLYLVYRSMRIPALHRAEARQSALVSFGLRALGDEPSPALWEAAVAVSSEVLGAEFGYLIAGGDQPALLAALGNIIGGVIARSRAEEALRESEARREELLSDMLRAEEEERLRIAAELHDDTIQVMTASLLAMDSLEHAIADEKTTTALR